MPFVSIEISSFNNKKVLRLVLERLALQDYPLEKIEVVISDDGSTDGLLDMLGGLVDSLPYRVTILEHDHKGPAHAHNSGIAACSADIVIMLAADILASPQLVSEHIKLHREHPDSRVVVSGKLIQSPELKPTVFQLSWNKWVNKLYGSESLDLRHGNFFVSNLSFKKKFMLTHGLFLHWPPAAQEDIELGHRLKSQGMVLLRGDQALGYHHHEATLESVAVRSYMEGYNWHCIESVVEESWVRIRSGQVKVSDGFYFYLAHQFKTIIRRCLLNPVTVNMLIVPVIKHAENVRVLVPLVPVFAAKVAAFYFQKGLKDYGNKIPWDVNKAVNL